MILKKIKKTLLKYAFSLFQVLFIFCILLFVFTAGIHFEKKNQKKNLHAHFLFKEQTPFQAEKEKIPSRSELIKQSKDASILLENALKKTLYEEIKKNNLKLKKTKQLDLPSQTLSPTEGATTLESLNE